MQAQAVQVHAAMQTAAAVERARLTVDEAVPVNGNLPGSFQYGWVKNVIREICRFNDDGDSIKFMVRHPMVAAHPRQPSV
eukprot:COSAG03_NODE_14485_length_462_cov_1.837466_2_plen_79_part_01